MKNSSLFASGWVAIALATATVLALSMVVGASAFAAASSPSSSSSSGSSKSGTELRLFVTENNFASPQSTMNTDLSASSIEAFKSIPGVGFELNSPILPMLKVGIRGGGRWKQSYSATSSGANSPNVAAQQGYGGAILRLSLLQSSFLHADLFGEGGLTKTHIDIQTPSEAGTYSGNFLPYTRGGASVALGIGKVFIFAEGGYEQNKVTNLSATGTLDTSVGSIDFSGTYFAFGLIFNGIPSFIKTQ